MRVNENFVRLPESYLFSEVAGRLRRYKEDHPDADIIRMDIGDVTLPLAPCVIDAMHRAVDDMAATATFRGYGPEQGYAFLRDAIAKWDYQDRGIDISSSEIFISDGAKSDLGNLSDIYSEDSIVAVADPGYPVYVDSSVMAGRGGAIDEEGKWSRIVYLPCHKESGFKPSLPEGHVDIIFLCSPCNPTGVTLSKEELKEWVDYARNHKSLIIYDSAYEAFVTDPNVPRSIYEVDGAKEVAIEVRSFSKTAGFTGLRCGYTVVPDELYGYCADGTQVKLGRLWQRRQTTKFNGASYIIQRGAEALYTPEGREAIARNIDIYLSNAREIRESLERLGFDVFGGENSPYIWVRREGENDSWSLFDEILDRARVSSTPGVGFGPCGRGYIRFTGFNTPVLTREAMHRIGEIKW